MKYEKCIVSVSYFLVFYKNIREILAKCEIRKVYSQPGRYHKGLQFSHQTTSCRSDLEYLMQVVRLGSRTSLLAEGGGDLSAAIVHCLLRSKFLVPTLY